MTTENTPAAAQNPLCLPTLSFSAALEATINFVKTNAKALLPLIAVISFPIFLVQNFIITSSVASLGIRIVNGAVDQASLNEFIQRSGGDANTVMGLLGKVMMYQTVISMLSSIVFLIMTLMLMFIIWKLSTGKTPTNADALDFAKQNFLGMFLVSFLSGLAVLCGLILLIIPGLLVAARIFLSPWIFVVEGKKGKSALLESKSLTKGKTLSYLLYLIGIGVISAIASAVVVGVLGILGKGIIASSITTAIANCIQIIPLVFSAVLYFTIRGEKSSETTLE